MFILIIGFFYTYRINFQLIKRNSINNNILGWSLNKEPDPTCEFIEGISKEELEFFKNDLLSRFTNIEYETYIKQFWVGLLEGDGTITVSSPGPNHVKVRILISIKNYKENVLAVS